MSGRCAWVGSLPEMIRYHDEEWGVPVRGDDLLFEMLTLGGAQAGLSWQAILLRREGYRRAFHGFSVDRVAAMTEAELAVLMEDPGVIRNRAKLASTVANARAVQRLQAEVGPLTEYLWSFVGGRPIVNRWADIREIPVRSPESDAMAASLKERGFSFVGSTILYATMQAAGMINDHTTDCPRWQECQAASGNVRNTHG